MSSFEERLRDRVNALISETMDDVASEIRKAVTPPAKKSDEERAMEMQLGRIAQEKLLLSGRDEMFGSQVWLNFDEKAFKDWFIRQVRIHGGLKNFLPR